MRRESRKAEPALVELIPSRWDDEPILRAQLALRGLGSVDGFSLELAATSRGVGFYMRAASAEVMEQVRAQLGAAYPLADLKHVPLTDRPTLDPLWRGHDEAGAAVRLRLQRGSDLPLVADWRDRGDPLAGLLAAASALGHGERVVCQTVLSPAPACWADHLRARLPASQIKAARPIETRPAADILPLLALFGIGALGMQGYDWYKNGQLLPLIASAGAGVLGIPVGAMLVARFLAGRQPLSARLVEEKLAHPAFAVQLRVLAFGPSGGSRERLRSLVARVAAAYRAFDHPAGNGLIPRPWCGDPTSPHHPTRDSSAARCP